MSTVGDYHPTRAPKKVVQSLTDIDAGVAEFRDLYLSLSSLGCADLRKINMKFGTDPYFSLGINEYLKPPCSKTKTFRFMGLPPELRLHVASYALVAQKPLTWRWTKLIGPARGRIGSFENFEEAEALTRVSRQLHAVLSPLIWEVNTFEFNHIRMGDDLRITALSESCSLFTRSMSPYQLAKLSIRLEMYGDASTDYESGAGSVPHTLSQIAQQLPQTRIQVVDRRWTLHKTILKDRR